MNYALDCALEDDGRWFAEVVQLPGVLAYGSSREEAMARAQAPALRVIADQIEHGESPALEISIALPAAA